MGHTTELRHVGQDDVTLQLPHEVHNVPQSLGQRQQAAARCLLVSQLGLYGLLGWERRSKREQRVGDKGTGGKGKGRGEIKRTEGGG